MIVEFVVGRSSDLELHCHNPGFVWMRMEFDAVAETCTVADVAALGSEAQVIGMIELVSVVGRVAALERLELVMLSFGNLVIEE